jgi:carbamoyltransferase
MEYGPRALGSRSILGDARNQEMQTTINLKIKYRESFRPFAPAVLEECISEYFELDRETPYMLLVAPVVESRRLPFEPAPDMTLYEVVRQPRSDVPAITHVDYSARIQSVRREDHPDYYDVINAFRAQTGYGVIINTSFNVRGEPIICSPYDAYRCFMRTEMDVLAMGDFLLFKEEQPAYPIEKGHIEHYDPNELLDRTDDPGLEPLRHLFQESFLPVSDRYRTSSEQRGKQKNTSAQGHWHDFPAQSASQHFEIPEVLLTGQGDVQETAAAIVSYWQPGFARNAVELVIARLLEIGQELSAVSEEQELLEEVSEFVYVMY